MSPLTAPKTVLSAWPLLLFAAVACSRPADRASKRPSTVIVGYCCADDPLSPTHSMEAMYLVFMSLLRLDDRGELTGRLAREWEHSEDYQEWTYHLRTDVLWHDGVPVTAHDVEFTVHLMGAFWDLDYGRSAIESITVHDDSTVTIRSGHSRTYQLFLKIFPKHLLEDLDPERLSEWEFWKRPVGSGPYRFVRLEPRTMVEFEANPDFYLGKPRIEHVILKFSRDAAITELLAGEVDVTGIGGPSVPTVTADPRFRIHHWIAPWSSQAVFWKTDHPILGDPRVRRALTHAIDRRALHRLLGLPEGIPITDGPHTTGQYLRRDLLEPLAHDPALAGALLDSAGWRDTDGDGIRDRDGLPLRFTALTRNVSGENTPGNLSSATFVQSELRKVGVQLELQALDPSVVSARREAGDFDAFFQAIRFWEAPWLGRYRLGESLRYRNARVTELIERASRTWIPEEEDRVYRELAEIFQRDQPLTMLYPWTMWTAVHRRVRGLASSACIEPVECMERLWLEDPS